MAILSQRHLSAFVTLFIAFSFSLRQVNAQGRAAVSPIPFQQGKKWGFMTPAGRIVIPAKYDLADRFHEGRAAVEINHRIGFINETGHLVIPPRYDVVGQFHEGRAWVGMLKSSPTMCQAGSFAQDAFAKEKTYPAFPDSPFSWRHRRLENLSQSSYVDLAGKIVFPMGKYVCTTDYSGGLTAVQKTSNGAWVMTDKTGRVALSRYGNRPFRSLGNLSEGLIAFSVDSEDGKTLAGYLDRSGKTVIAPRFVQTWDFHEGLAAVLLRSEAETYIYAFINQKGKVVTPTYDNIMSSSGFHEGVALLYYINENMEAFGPSKEDLLSLWKGCFVDKRGQRLRITAQTPFSEGLAASKDIFRSAEDLWGYVDKTGKWAIPARYKRTLSFIQGTAYVQYQTEKAENWHVINKTGKEIKPHR